MNKEKIPDIIIYAWCEKCSQESEIFNESYRPDWICPKCGKKGAENFFKVE